MMRDHYSQATVALLRAGGDVETIIAGLRRTLMSRGHESLLPQILQGVLRGLTDRFDSSLATVTAASEHAVRAEDSAIETALKRLGASSAATVGIDHSLVGGFVVEYRHKRLDASHKRALKELYRAITNA